MGRAVIADGRVQKYVSNLYSSDAWAVGFLIGQLTPQKDYVVHIVKCPQMEEKENPPATLVTVDEVWVATYSQQVLRMLPGGLDIIGIFGMAPPDVMKDAQNKLKQILFAVHKVVQKSNAIMQSSDGVIERILLQICHSSRKLICRSYDISDYSKSTARPADWKFQNIMDRWARLNTDVTMDLEVPISVSNMKQSLNKQIQLAIAPFKQSVWEAIATVNNQLVPGCQQLVSDGPHGKKEKKQKSTQEMQPVMFAIHLMVQMAGNNNIVKPETVECGAKMLIRGRLSSRAFVHSKATVQEAVQALKLDVIRSLSARCQLLCEDLLQTEEEQDVKVLYETPLRIFATSPDCPLSFCDYMFQDEAESDSIERFRELLGLDISEDHLEMDCESIPTEEEVAKPDKLHSFPILPQQKQPSNLTGILGMLGGVAAAALAAAFSYMYIGTD